MLSDEEKRKLIEQYSFGRDINAFALVAEVERAVLAKAMPAHKQEHVGYLVIGQGISFYKTTFDEARHQANLLEWRDDNEPAIHPVYLNPMPQQAAAIPEYNENVPADCLSPTVAKARRYGDPKNILSAAPKPDLKVFEQQKKEFCDWFVLTYFANIHFDGDKIVVPTFGGRSQGKSVSLCANVAWAAWQKARQSAVIELPKPTECCGTSRHYWPAPLKDHIEAQGFRVEVNGVN